MGELPKYIMKYLVTAWENTSICTFSRRLEAIIKINREKLAEDYNYFSVILRTYFILSFVQEICQKLKTSI